MGTFITCQTLATNWFTRYRARAVAFVLTAGGVVGKLVYQFDNVMAQHYSWRTGWFVLALLTLTLAVLGWLLVRNRPADLGQHPDGIDPTSDAVAVPLQGERPGLQVWTLRAVVRTPQFAVLCLSATACFVPWTVCAMHGRMHLEGLGLSTDVTAGILGTMVLLSVVGRLTGGWGIFWFPRKYSAMRCWSKAPECWLSCLQKLLFWHTSRRHCSPWGSGPAISPWRWCWQGFWGRCFCPGARGQLPDCRNLAGHFSGTGRLDV